MDPEHFAEMVVEALRMYAHGRIRTLARGDVQHAVRTEGKPRAIVLGAVIGRYRPKDHSNLLQATPVGRQHAPGDSGAVAAPPRLGIAPVDCPVGREVRAQCNIEQTALAAGVDRRHPDYRRTQIPFGRDDSHTAGFFGDEHIAAWKRFHRPRLLKPSCQYNNIKGDIGLDDARTGLPGKCRVLVLRVRSACFERGTGVRPTRCLSPGATRTGHQGEHRDKGCTASLHREPSLATNFIF
ncbi:protein of unknown function [Methylocaldum szegediense]|uniref:Uncharacterized protein n=1 Tax=Methylocaldum szegediense TaxID=73780 RepID=A0ABM9I2M9_9GAMM|nr:protein of unknown function [Methylocaldum szegediense]